jgi:hypothetical protein
MTTLQIGRANDGYGRVAIALHWLTAALVVANLLLGLSMVDLPISTRKLQWYIWHKWIGITVFLVTSIRLGWRAVHPAPPPVPMPEWPRMAASSANPVRAVVAHPDLRLVVQFGDSAIVISVVPLPTCRRGQGVADLLRRPPAGTGRCSIICLHTAAAIAIIGRSRQR